MNPEIRRTFNQSPEGTSLKELLPVAANQYKGNGPRTSEKVVWLADAMEGTEFWSSLNNLIANDSVTRQSVGGVFHRASGDQPVGPHRWNQLYASLDGFLKGFDERATEFIFRDFRPSHNDIEVRKLIDATRTLALDKYPRLRRIFWDDYAESLETPIFWRSLARDLQNLREKISSSAFFYQEVDLKGNSDPRLLPTSLQANSVLHSMASNGVPGARAKFLSYPNLSQIIRDVFHQNPRQFLLGFNPKSEDENLRRTVETTKVLIEEKILPPKPRPETLEKITKNQLARTLRSPEFWEQFNTDLNNHTDAQHQAYSLHYFLRAYNRESQNVGQNGFGDYAHLITPFMRRKKGPVFEQLTKPSKGLALLLMWKFQPEGDIAEQVIEAKRLCSEIFPQDCLYVALQTPDFWEEFSEDLNSIQGTPSFAAFLRFFNMNNLTADGRKHKKGSARYQLYLQRAYHKPKEFDSLCNELGVETGMDYNESLANFFYRFAPDGVKDQLKTIFPQDFTEEGKISKLNDHQLLQQSKDFLKSITPGFAGLIECESDEEVERVRLKLQTAARTLNIHIRSRLDGNTIVVNIADRKKFNASEMAAIEPQVIELRKQGLQNKEIAEILGLKEYDIVYISGKLIKKGLIERRR